MAVQKKKKKKKAMHCMASVDETSAPSLQRGLSGQSGPGKKKEKRKEKNKTYLLSYLEYALGPDDGGASGDMSSKGM
jgi:hypothetical protein